MFHKIKFVAYVPDYKLSVQFAEGVTKIYDLNILMDKIADFKIFKLNRDDFEKILIDDLDVGSQFVYSVANALKVELKDMFNKNYKHV